MRGVRPVVESPKTPQALCARLHELQQICSRTIVFPSPPSFILAYSESSRFVERAFRLWWPLACADMRR